MVMNQQKRKLDHPPRLLSENWPSVFVNPRRQLDSSTKAKTRLTLVFVALRVHGMGLVKARFVSEASRIAKQSQRHNPGIS